MLPQGFCTQWPLLVFPKTEFSYFSHFTLCRGEATHVSPQFTETWMGSELPLTATVETSVVATSARPIGLA